MQKINIEATIDTRPVSLFQMSVIAACAMIALVDGFHTQLIAFVAPQIMREWGLDKASMGPVFSASLVGLMIGSIVFGPIGDRFGRKLVVLGSFLAVGIFSLATATAASADELMAYRFLTGLGLGGSIPNVIAITAEYAPRRIRSTLVTIMSCGFPLGASLGGLVIGRYIADLGWQTIFVFGGALPILLSSGLIWMMPESLRLLVKQTRGEARVRSILRKIDPSLRDIPTFMFTEINAPPKSFTIRSLLGVPHARQTIILWLLFFFNLMVSYFILNWLPTLLAGIGKSLGQAVVGATIFNFGGIIGSVAMARGMDVLGPRRVLVPAYIAVVPFVAMTGFEMPLALTFFFIFMAGGVVLGAQFCLNALAAESYPANLRSTGLGWALGVGRMGSIMGPLIGSWLMAAGLPLETVFALAGLPALICLGAVLFLERSRGSESAL